MKLDNRDKKGGRSGMVVVVVVVMTVLVICQGSGDRDVWMFVFGGGDSGGQLWCLLVVVCHVGDGGRDGIVCVGGMVWG